MDKARSNQLGLGAAVDRLQHYFKEGLDLIKAVQDEGRLELHLGRMDAQEGWETLEADLSKAEHQALQEAPVVLDHAIEALRSMRRRVSREPAKRSAPPAHR